MARRNGLAERFPLVGRGLSAVRFRTPRDADWLPRNWQSPTYPKGKKGGDNTEAIVQWLECEICRCQEYLIPLFENPELGPEVPGECDRGGPVQDAYRLVEQLQEEAKGGAAPPCEPSRGYVHYRDDLKAVVAELRKVREWVAETTGRRAKGGRKPDPEIAERNEKIVEMFKSGKDVGAVCERFHISAALARKIKSEAGLAGG